MSQSRLRQAVRHVGRQALSTVAFSMVMTTLVVVMFLLLGYRVRQRLREQQR